MNRIKNAGHLSLFIVASFITTSLLLSISLIIPLLLYFWMFNINGLLFLLIYSLFAVIYKYSIYAVYEYYYELLEEYKPDFFYSNIALGLTALLNFYLVVSNIITSNSPLLENIFDIKGVMLIFVLPAIYFMVFFSIIFPLTTIKYKSFKK